MNCTVLLLIAAPRGTIAFHQPINSHSTDQLLYVSNAKPNPYSYSYSYHSTKVSLHQTHWQQQQQRDLRRHLHCNNQPTNQPRQQNRWILPKETTHGSQLLKRRPLRSCHVVPSTPRHATIPCCCWLYRVLGASPSPVAEKGNSPVSHSSWMAGAEGFSMAWHNMTWSTVQRSTTIVCYRPSAVRLKTAAQPLTTKISTYFYAQKLRAKK